jgi:hypothetical protein
MDNVLYPLSVREMPVCVSSSSPFFFVSLYAVSKSPSKSNMVFVLWSGGRWSMFPFCAVFRICLSVCFELTGVWWRILRTYSMYDWVSVMAGMLFMCFILFCGVYKVLRGERIFFLVGCMVVYGER